MTMHLLPVYFSTTSTRKRKQSKKSKSLLKAEADHKKFLKRMGVDKTKPKQAAVAQSVEHLICNQKVEGSNPSGGTIPTNCIKPEPKVYTGTEIIGIGQMHKSNAVPIRRKQDAKDLANMRR